MNRQPAVEEFFAKIHSAGFFTRLFSWKKIRNAADKAYQEMQESIADAESAAEEAVREADAEKYKYTVFSGEAERRLSDAEKAAAQKAEESAAVRVQLAAESARLETEQRQRAEAEAANSTLSIEKERLQSTLQEMQTKLTLAEDRFAAEKEQREKTEAEKSTISNEKEQLQNILQETQTKLSLAEEKLASEKEQHGKTEAEKSAISNEKEQLKSTLQETQTKLSLAEEKLAAEKEQHEKTAAELEELSGKAAETDELLAKTREELSAAQSVAVNEREKYEEIKKEADEAGSELTEVKKQLAAEESVKEQRAADYEQRITTLNTLIEQMNEDHKRAEDRIKEEMEAHNAELATSWQRHEKEVEDTLRSIAKRYCINRCEKGEYPYAGTPDNVFLVGGMYTVFDAKSPKNPEDLENFPGYLKQQAEGMKKYCKNENVRKDAFLVVPGSAVSTLDTFVYQLADYTVYVITLDAVLPILQMLKTLEAYDFAEQLSPEDRDKLCKYIGKLSHTAKRKVQIDTYLSQEMVSVLREASTLPDEFAKEIEGYEQRSKLNPPIEKRAKLIAIDDISSDVAQVERDILGWSKVEEHELS